MSKINFQQKSEIDKLFTIKVQRSNKLWNEFLQIRNPTTDEQLARVVKNFKSEWELALALEDVKFLLNHRNQYFLNLIDYFTVKKSFFCSSQYLLVIYFELPDISLQTLFEKYWNTNKTLSQRRITDFLYQTVTAYALTQDQIRDLYWVSDENIFVDKSCNFKVGFHIWDQEEKLTKVMTKEFFLSPQEYFFVTQNKGQAKSFNRVKSHVFSLGLIILKLGNMKSVQHIYSPDGSINQNALDELFLQFKSRYQSNTLLVTSVQKMLEPYEENRPTFTELYEALPPYSKIKTYFKENEVVLGLSNDNIYNFMTQGENQVFNTSAQNEQIKDLSY